MRPDERIDNAVAVALRYGGIDGDHHKQWVIDQMIRALLAPAEYDEFVRDSTLGPNGEPDHYSPWDHGIPP